MHKFVKRTFNLPYCVSRRTFTNKDTRQLFEKMSGKEPEVPYETDIVVIGGGLVGMMCAYWIKQLSPLSFTLSVVEKDTSLKNSATSLYYEGLRQQHPMRDCISMAKFSASFLRDVKEHLAIPDLQQPDISFTPQGCLTLSNEQSSQQLHKSICLQKSMGVGLDEMDGQKLGQLFPWINSSDVPLASLGYVDEGWFDVGLLMSALKGKVASMGVKFINGEVVSFGKESNKVFSNLTNKVEEKFNLREVGIKLGSTGEVRPLKFSRCVVSAGASSAALTLLAGIGADETTPTALPIIPRLKHAYLLECLDGPGLDMPMIYDTNDVFVRRQNQLGHFICTALRPLDDNINDDVNNDRFFRDHVQPTLVHRIPAFKSLKMIEQWSAHVDHNYFDHSLFLSNHPYYLNMFIASGGPTMELSPAVGKTIMEIMLKNNVELVDRDKVSFDRVMYDEKREA